MDIRMVFAEFPAFFPFLLVELALSRTLVISASFAYSSVEPPLRRTLESELHY